MKKIKAHIPLILNVRFITPLNKLPINSGSPHLIKIFESTKKGNNDGNTLFLNTLSEKSTEFKILSDSVKISYTKNNNTPIIKTLIHLRIISPTIK